MLMVPVKCEYCPCKECDSRYSETGLNKFAVVENIRKIPICALHSITIIRVPWETEFVTGGVFCIYGDVYVTRGLQYYEFLDEAVKAMNIAAGSGHGSDPFLHEYYWGEEVCGAWGSDETIITHENPVIGGAYRELFPVNREELCDACD